MELVHFDKHSPVTRERKAPQSKNRRVFFLETLENFILNDKFYLKMTTIRALFLQIRALFSSFQKRVRETSPPPSPPLVTRLVFTKMQRRIQNPVKCLRWIFSQKYLTIFSRYLLLRKMPSKMFDRVLNTPLEYAHFVYIVYDKFVIVIWSDGLYRRFE